MKEKTAPIGRIDIFHAPWPLQIHTVNLVRDFSEAGYCGDLFLYEVSDNYAGDPFEHFPNVVVRRFQPIGNHLKILSQINYRISLISKADPCRSCDHVAPIHQR